MYNDFDGKNDEPIDLSGHLSGLLKWPTFGTLSVRAACTLIFFRHHIVHPGSIIHHILLLFILHGDS